MYDNSVASVVNIKNYQDGRLVGRGTGFFLEPGDKIVTNDHVIDSADHLIVETYWRRQIKIDKVLARDDWADLAILPVPASFHPDSLALADRSHSLGERVFAIGFPRATRFGISEGTIVQLGDLMSRKRGQVQVDLSSGPGGSGSPLLDVDGNVVGVIRGGDSTSKMFTFAVHQNEIRRLLTQDLRPKNISEGYYQPGEAWDALVELFERAFK